MGLDMYLIAKREHQTTSGVRGACNGLIPLAPKTDKEEVGYWRKAYSVSNMFWNMLNITADDNCKEFEVSLENLQSLLSYAEEEVNGGNLNEWNRYDWTNTISICKKAINLIKNDNAKIYYMEWY